MKTQNQKNSWQMLKAAVFKRKVNLLGITAALFIYAINKAFLISHTAGTLNYFCRCYLNDLVCPFFFLGYCQILLLWMLNREIKSYWKCMLLMMAAGCVWEYGSPIINSRAVSDPWDLLCYFVGGTVYFLMIKCEQGRRK